MPAHDPRIEALLRALAPGQRLWLRAGGRSLWPFVLDHDQLHVERGTRLERGDIALIVHPTGALVAHLVESVDPLVTVSSIGVADPPAIEVLGRVVAIKRGVVTFRLPAVALRQVPRLARALRRVPGLRHVVRRFRDPP